MLSAPASDSGCQSLLSCLLAGLVTLLLGSSPCCRCHARACRQGEGGRTCCLTGVPEDSRVQQGVHL